MKGLKAKMVFDQDQKKIGTIKDGQLVEINYSFVNSGEEPLLLYDIQTGCGCTVANWPTKVIKPGASGHIYIKFDSHGKSGLQRKFITVFSNSIEDIKILSFEGNVQSTIKS